MTNWKLGSNQRDVLRSLRDHSGYPGVWYWGSAGLTIRILDTLVKRDLVRRIEIEKIIGLPPYRYEITDSGRDALEALGGIYADPKRAKAKTAHEIELDRLAAMSPNALKVEFETIMCSIAGTSSHEILAGIAVHAGMVWTEMTGRGIEFR